MLCNGFEVCKEMEKIWFQTFLELSCFNPCLHTRLPLFLKVLRGQLYNGGRPPVGGLLHKAPAEEKLYLSDA